MVSGKVGITTIIALLLSAWSIRLGRGCSFAVMRETMATLYICNQKKCTRCIPECHHTVNEFYARDDEHEFETDNSGNLWEKPKEQDDWKLDI